MIVLSDDKQAQSLFHMQMMYSIDRSADPLPMCTKCRLTVTIGYLSETSFLLVRTTQRMFPLGLCQYIEDQYVFSLGP